MTKRTIQYIIVLMSIALLGIAMIQYFWLKRSIDLNAKNFDDKVTLAIDRIKYRLEQDAKDLGKYSSELQSSLKLGKESNSAESPGVNFFDRRKRDQILSNLIFLKPQEALNNIDLVSLDRYVNAELGSKQIGLKYDYGIYSVEESDYIIMNGKFNVLVKNDDESSESGIVRNLNRRMYEQSLYSEDGISPVAYLRLFFPRRNSFLIATILPSLFSSIVFTSMILFCFVYTINIILTQKKISLMKTDFINNMTHEFKTPIATISLAADSINNPMVSSKPELIRRYANIIKEENERMLNQVEKVLRIAKVDKKDFELHLDEVDINQVVAAAADLAEFKVSSREGSVVRSLAATKPLILADENHVSNIVHNLLDNAEKYSLEKPFINIGTKNVKKGVEVTISDRGIGMHKDELKRIFEKFYRVSTGNVHDVKGFGLGLSYVKAMVDAHKGKVDVQSELGKGSTFTVFLPFDPKKD